MRHHPILIPLCAVCVLALTACQKTADADLERALQDVNALDEADLSHLMLNASDPEEAVTYFARSAEQAPERIDFRRGLGVSLVRANRPGEAVEVWRQVIAHPDATSEDRVELADALIRDGKWAEAEAVLDSIPPTYETYKRYRLEAMIADGNQEWEKADSFYEIAAGLTTKPAGVLNNWGYSRLTRGDYRGAEELFIRALRIDRSMFTAKNNLVLARSAQRNYDLPVIEMTQIERAHLLHTIALSAIKQGDVSTGRGLLQEAIDTHPQHFEAAVRSLRALESNVLNG